jgi:[ribosomal protein S5]-alanine N-acetyltransferase
MPDTQLRTSKLSDLRVLIRPPQVSDEAAFLNMSRHSQVLHQEWVNPPSTSEQFRTYVEQSHLTNRDCSLVFLKENLALVGVFNLSEIVRGSFHSAYMGYYGNARFQRQGLMREGLELVLNRAFQILQLHRIEANIQPNNYASRQLVFRAGFRVEGFSPRYLKINGRWRDHERWAILHEDWLAFVANRAERAGQR